MKCAQVGDRFLSAQDDEFDCSTFSGCLVLSSGLSYFVFLEELVSL